MKITICGGGNAAHALAGILSTHQSHQIAVYAPFGEESKRWQREIDALGGLLVVYEHKKIRGGAIRISSDPAEVVPGA